MTDTTDISHLKALPVAERMKLMKELSESIEAEVPPETESERVGRLGETWYEKIDIGNHRIGSYLAIDVASGAFVHAETDIEASDKAEVAFHGAPYYLRRVGATPYRRRAVRG